MGFWVKKHPIILLNNKEYELIFFRTKNKYGFINRL